MFPYNSGGIVICGFPGVGKSFLAKQHPEHVIDLDSSSFSKLSTGEVNPLWPQNYVVAIREHLRNFSMVLVSTHREIRSILAQNKINFVIVMPSMDQKEEYMSRYRQRVGHPLSLDVIDKNWKLFIGDCLSDRNTMQIAILSPGQTLVDFLEEVSDPVGQVCGSLLTDVDPSVIIP